MEVVIYLLLAVAYLYDTTLDYLNYRYRNQPLSDTVMMVYDESRYRAWKGYFIDQLKFKFLERTIRYGWMFLLLITGVFYQMVAYLEALVLSPLILNGLFLIGYFLLMSLVDIPMDYMKSFRIEKRHGFFTGTVKTFVMDKIKAFLLTILIGGVTLLGLLKIFGTSLTNTEIILVSVLVAISVQLTVNILYTKIFVRIFNKLTPLPEGDLKAKIESLARKSQVQIRSIEVMNASLRTTKLNAFFSGFGKVKRIVLFDTLLKEMNEEEILSVLAHEIGHGKHRHVLLNLLVSCFLLFIYISAFILIVRSQLFAHSFGFTEPFLGFGIILFTIIISPLDSLIRVPLSALSRHFEYQADHYTTTLGLKESMKSALIHLARVNLSNLTPHPFVVKCTYSHPPIDARIKALDQIDSH